MKKTNIVLLAIASLTLLFSCKKDNSGPNEGGPDPLETLNTYGVYVLNEGNFGQNNTMLTYYDLTSQIATTDFYEKVNGNGLGDTGNDMIVYGGKMYIAMNVSNYVEIADARTGRNIDKIKLLNEFDAPRGPRHLAFDGSNVFVSCQDGTVQVIDTSSLQIVHSIRVGSSPEGMAVSRNQLFVANSGGFNFPDYDSTLSVVDLKTFQEVKKITVGLNPVTMASDDKGNVYVGFVGNYGNVPGGITKVNASNGTVTAKSDIAGGKMQYYSDALYVVAGPFGQQKVQVLDPSNLSLKSANFITDGTAIESPYALNIDGTNGDVYIGDQIDYVSPGVVYCFDKTGKKKFSFSVKPGTNPNTVTFLRK